MIVLYHLKLCMNNSSFCPVVLKASLKDCREAASGKTETSYPNKCYMIDVTVTEES